MKAGAFTTGGSNTFTFTHPQNATPADDVSVAVYSWSVDQQSFVVNGATAGGTTVDFAAVPDTPATGTTTVTATITGTIPDKLFVDVAVTQVAP